MTDTRSFVIVGASLAGAKAAETLRAEGFEGRIVLVGEEPVRPYERPPLTKHFLQGVAGGHRLFIHDDGYYVEHAIELRLSTRVTALETGERRVVLESGETIGYDAVLLTTGAEARRIRIPGSELSGVHYLRSLADAEALKETLSRAGRVVVVGAGWIGCEAAASAREMGVEVAMAAPGRLPLERVLGTEMGTFFRDVHADRGVELHLGVGVEAFRGGEAVEEVVLADGTVLAAEAVVVGIGATPRVELAEGAGIELGNGVVTDEHMATSAPGVFAAGDVADAWHPRLGRRLRLEHWSSALNQGPCAARNMLGAGAVYDRVPFFFSDQYDVGMEYTGHATGWDRLVYRGDPAGGKFIVFWMRDDRLLAGMNVNVWDVRDAIAGIVASGRPVDAAALADPGVDLADLAARLTPGSPT